MSEHLVQQIEQLAKDKGIDVQIIHRALEEAMAAAAKKYFKTAETLQARFDTETGEIPIFAVKEVVEEVEDPDIEMTLEEVRKLTEDDSFEVGDFIEIAKPQRDLGRIAAQTAKQVINQKIKEAERERTFEEYADQVGQLESAIVRRREGRDVIVEIGNQRTEALLPFSDQSRIEQYKPNDRVSVVVTEVHRISKGPQIIVSRTNPALLIRLFEREIPEVYDNTVTIKHAVREGGERAKVSVASNDDTVDPVGACVGMKGSRINAVIRELRGEKIDIIEYSGDIAEYTMNALKPARISRVLVSEAEARVLEVIVPEDQLSLAIGKKGQNVRLASKLVGWEIDIKSEEEKKQEILSQMEQFAMPAEPQEGEPVSVLVGLGAKNEERLREAGFESIQQLAEASAEELTAIPGIGDKTAEKLISAAREHRPEETNETEEEVALEGVE